MKSSPIKTELYDGSFFYEDKLKPFLELSPYEKNGKNGLKPEKRPYYFYATLMRAPFSEMESDDFEKAVFACLSQVNEEPRKILEYLELITSLPDDCALSLMISCYKIISLQTLNEETPEIKSQLFELIETKYFANGRKLLPFDKETISEEVRTDFIAVFGNEEMEKLVDVGLKAAAIAMPLIGAGVVAKRAYEWGYQVANTDVIDNSDKLPPIVNVSWDDTLINAAQGVMILGVFAAATYFLYDIFHETPEVDVPKPVIPPGKKAPAKGAARPTISTTRQPVSEVSREELLIVQLNTDVNSQSLNEARLRIKQQKKDWGYSQMLKEIYLIDPRYRLIERGLVSRDSYTIPSNLDDNVRERLESLLNETMLMRDQLRIENDRTNNKVVFSIASDLVPRINEEPTRSRSHISQKSVRWVEESKDEASYKRPVTVTMHEFNPRQAEYPVRRLEELRRLPKSILKRPRNDYSSQSTSSSSTSSSDVLVNTISRPPGSLSSSSISSVPLMSSSQSTSSSSSSSSSGWSKEYGRILSTEYPPCWNGDGK